MHDTESSNRIKKLKYHPHGAVLFITFSIEDGLLLLCNPLCEAIIKSCLARAQFLHPVVISGFLVEANHVHLILVVNDPEDVPGFVRCFKTETAHMFNRLLGRRKHTIWCESFDDPIVLSLPRALIAMAYIYSNPAKDNLEESIDHYPGVSSWKMFIRDECKKTWKRFRRSDLSLLPKDAQNFPGYTREAQRISQNIKESHEFTIAPNAWIEAFGLTSNEDIAKINEKLIKRVKKLEERARKKRFSEKHSVIGARKLCSQPFNLTYQSKRSGKRMWCLSEKRSLRIQFINFLKNLFYEARLVRKKWAMGDFSTPYPLGLYPPCVPKLAEPLNMWG